MTAADGLFVTIVNLEFLDRTTAEIWTSALHSEHSPKTSLLRLLVLNLNMI